jgi:hypothetical protein
LSRASYAKAHKPSAGVSDFHLSRGEAEGQCKATASRFKARRKLSGLLKDWWKFCGQTVPGEQNANSLRPGSGCAGGAVCSAPPTRKASLPACPLGLSVVCDFRSG